MILGGISTSELILISVLMFNLLFAAINLYIDPDLSNTWLGRKIKYLENRREKKMNARPLPFRWECLKKEMSDAEDANDYIKQQQINSQLEWLHCLYNHLCNQEIKNIHFANSDYGALMSGSKDWKVEDKARNRVYKKVKASDLILPEIFDVENAIHYDYCINIVSSFEGIVRNYELDDNSIEKNGFRNLDTYLEDYL